MQSKNSLNQDIALGTPWQVLLTRFPFWVAFILTVVVFLVLIKLGFWQLERAEVKSVIERQLIERQNRKPMLLTQVLVEQNLETLTGFTGFAKVRPIPERVILLDNQVHQGKVGYVAYQLAEVLSESAGEEAKWVLLELGFVPALAERSRLPDVMSLSETATISGRLYRRQVNPMSHQLYAEGGWPKRIQNLNFSQLSQELALDILPFAMQVQSVENWPYPHPWQPISMKSSKHFGYAVQWFAMSAVFALIMAMILARILTRTRRQQTTNEGGNNDNIHH